RLCPRLEPFPSNPNGIEPSWNSTWQVRLSRERRHRRETSWKRSFGTGPNSLTGKAEMDRRRKIQFGALLLVGIWFLNTFAIRYLTDDAGILGIYWSRRQWLHTHIVAGALPLLLGPILLWLGLERRSKPLHHIVLAGYVLGTAISGTG